jgi:hypothetical protein
MSDEFLSQFPGKSASQIGHAAAKSSRWDSVPAIEVEDPRKNFVESSLIDGR